MAIFGIKNKGEAKMTKKINISTRALTVIVTLAILLTSLPLTVFAIDLNDGEDEIISDENVSEEIGKATLYTYELTDRRDEYTKHFKQPDGSIVAVSFNTPLHIQNEDGKWEQIDNTLAEIGSEYSTSDSRIKFAKKTTGNSELFTLHNGNGKITMSLDGATKNVSGEITNYQADQNEDEIIKMSHLEKLNSSIKYSEILSGVDLEYVAVSNSIKENIIVKSELDSYVFSFTMKLNNLSALQNDDGSISVLNENEETVYRINAPYMYDANGELSYAVNYDLNKTGNKEYKIVVTAEAEWINSADRVFPVVIDPSVSPADSSVVDTYIYSGSASTNHSSEGYFCLYNNFRNYWKNTTLPSIPNYAYITSADFSLRNLYFYTGANLGLYRVTSDWNSSFMYNDYPSSGAYATNLTDAVITSSSNDNRTHFDITDIVNGWYSGTYSNYGVCMTYLSGNSSCSFYSNDYATVSYHPRLMITYKDQYGLEDYWSYLSQSAGYAGSGAVNLANGNLVFNISTLTSTDSLMPYTPSFVYNSALAGYLFSRYNRSVPYRYVTTSAGFKTNMNTCIVPRTRVNESGASETYYIYTDADGTEHAFYKSTVSGENNIYYDEDGKKLKLTVNSNSFTIKDNASNIYTFTKKDVDDSYTLAGGYLTKVTDINGNELGITCNNYGRPTALTITPSGANSSITQLTFNYNSSGTIRYVLNPTSQHAVLLYFSSTYNGTIGTGYKFIRKIVYAHQTGSTSASNWSTFYTNGTHANITVDAVCTYDYDSGGRLTDVVDELNNYKLKYTYDSAERVVEVQEYGGSTAGQKLSISYGTGFTQVRTSGSDDIFNNSDDILTNYVFDNE